MRKRTTKKVTKTRRTKQMAKRKSRNYTVVNRTPNGIALRLLTTVKYSEQFTLTVGAITANDQVFRINSIHDINFTGVGHQPLFHDQLQTIYNRYRVFRCRGIIELSTTGNSVYHTLLPINVSTSYSNYSLAAEQPFALNKVGDLQGRTVFRFNYYMPKLNGVTPVQYKTDERFQAQFGSNPTEGIFLHLVSLAAGSSTTVFVNCTFYQDIECYDPNDVSQS